MSAKVKLIRNLSLAALICFFAYLFTGAVILPALLEKELPLRINNLTGRTAKIGNITINPITFVITCEDFRLFEKDTKSGFAGFKALRAEVIPLKLLKRTVAVRELKIKSPSAAVRRFPDGRFNFSDISAAFGSTKKQNITTDSKASYTVDIFRTLLTDGALSYVETFRDNTTSTVRITGIGLTAQGFSTHKDSKSRFALKGALEGGRLKAEGQAAIDPLWADISFTLDSIPLTLSNPYIRQAADLSITKGGAGLSGRLKYTKEGSFKLTADGRADSVEVFSNKGQERLFAFQGLSVKNMAYTPKEGFSAKGAALNDFFLNIHIGQSGVLNLSALGKASGKKQAASAETSENQKGDNFKKHQFLIELITLQNGEVRFSDNRMAPPYKGVFKAMGGRVSSLGGSGPDSGSVDLFSRLDGSSPIEITGRLDPFGDKLLVDLKAELRNVNMKDLSPYVEKYTGYKAASGRLYMDLGYLVRENALDAGHRILLDGFGVAGESGSFKGTRLPIRLAIALLTDSDGKIDLEIPVKGTLDNPEFRVGGIIVKTLLNTLKKAVAAPFLLLKSLIGGEGDFSEIGFQYGLADVSPEGALKLDRLSEALSKRPRLAVSIETYASMEEEAGALRELKLQSIIQKSLDEIMTEQPELSKSRMEQMALLRAYETAPFPKPIDKDGKPKAIAPKEMEKLLRAHIVITEEDVRGLCLKRARAIQNYLVAAGKTAPGRITILPPVIEKQAQSKAVFTLSPFQEVDRKTDKS